MSEKEKKEMKELKLTKINKLYIKEELHRKFKSSSAKQGLLLQDLTEKVIKDYLEKEKVKNK